MRIKFCAYLFLIFLSFESYGQSQFVKQWDYRFGGSSQDYLWTFKKTVDDGFILGGYSQSGISGDKTEPSWGSYDYWLVKVNSSGLKVWDRRFGGSEEDGLYALISTNDNGFLLGGYSASGISGDKSQSNWDTVPPIRSDYWVIKTDSIGNIEWQQRFGGTEDEAVFSLKECVDGSFYIGGSSSSGNNGDRSQENWDTIGVSHDYWLIKTDSIGNKIWDKRYGGSGDDFMTCMLNNDDGSIVLGGWSNSNDDGDKSQPSIGSWDYWVIKIDSSGNKIWDKRFGGTSIDIMTDMTNSNLNGYILGGHVTSGQGGNISEPTLGNYDCWILEIDSVGNIVWEDRMGGNAGDEFNGFERTSDGGYLLNCDSYSDISSDKSENTFGLENGWIIKFDSTFTKEWDKTIFTTGHDERVFAIESNIGCYVIANQTNGGIGGYKSQFSWGGYDYWILKLCDTTLTSSLNSPEYELWIYPNPINDILSIEVDIEMNQPMFISIYNVLGQQVHYEKLDNPDKIYKTDIGFLDKGFYFVEISNETYYFAKKIIKQE